MHTAPDTRVICGAGTDAGGIEVDASGSGVVDSVVVDGGAVVVVSVIVEAGIEVDDGIDVVASVTVVARLAALDPHAVKVKHVATAATRILYISVDCTPAHQLALM